MLYEPHFCLSWTSFSITSLFLLSFKLNISLQSQTSQRNLQEVAQHISLSLRWKAEITQRHFNVCKLLISSEEFIMGCDKKKRDTVFFHCQKLSIPCRYRLISARLALAQNRNVPDRWR